MPPEVQSSGAAQSTSPHEPPKGSSPSPIALPWVLSGLLLLVCIPTLALWGLTRRDAESAAGELVRAHERLHALQTPAPEIAALSAELARAERGLQALQALGPTIAAGRADWAGAAAALAAHDPARIRLLALEQDGDALRLTGLASDREAVEAYVASLASADAFRRVALQSIEERAAPSPSPTEPAPPTPTSSPTATTEAAPASAVPATTPVATATATSAPVVVPATPGVSPSLSPTPSGVRPSLPTATGAVGAATPITALSPTPRPTRTFAPTPTLPSGIVVGPARPTATRLPPPRTPTPTRPLGDAYEPDDHQPRPISPGERQRHTFYPQGDMDRVAFRVKAGRLYEVWTYDLSIGVDTELAVLLHGRAYRNDDVAPGDRSSRVTFAAEVDGEALVTITNRDRYGVDNAYWVTLVELAGTPTPAAQTPTPTRPTATVSPTPTPPTPVCADAYEPDDAVGRIIVVGEHTWRSFCPQGDVDRAVFTAKAGHAYLIETLSLASGVDTHLTVQLGSATWTHDDRSPQDLGSSVQIQNQTGSDAPAFITVRNKGLYGPMMLYALRVRELQSGDVGDVYEPDVTSRRYIAVNEVQRRTFYPERDVDQAWLLVKAGRRYIVRTCGSEDVALCPPLAPGVDTVLLVTGPTTQCAPPGCQNDDRAPGTGHLGSYVEFVAAIEGEATITLYNKGLFGPDKAYYLAVSESGLAPTPTSPAYPGAWRPWGLSSKPLLKALPQAESAVQATAQWPIRFVVLLELRRGTP